MKRFPKVGKGSLTRIRYYREAIIDKAVAVLVDKRSNTNLDHVIHTGGGFGSAGTGEWGGSVGPGGPAGEKELQKEATL